VTVAYLVEGTKMVCIILLKSPDTSQTAQGARELVTMKNAEIGHAQW
jgi:hypothetical protein